MNGKPVIQTTAAPLALAVSKFTKPMGPENVNSQYKAPSLYRFYLLSSRFL